jgi:UDP-N-acetyl-D-mannosaminuronate dehydrogenase
MRFIPSIQKIFLQDTLTGIASGVDLYEVIHTIRQRPIHSNLMFPGIGVGGYYLSKDPLLASWARQNLIDGN